MKIRMISATTHVDLHNDRFTRDCLESMAQQTNSQSERCPLVLHHDVTIPPIGKVLGGAVELRDDGEYQLVDEGEIFENAVWFSVGDLRLFREESETDRLPFFDPYRHLIGADYAVSVDPINFDSYDAMEAFVSEVKQLSGTDFIDSQFGRKAAIPDPEMIIRMAPAMVASLMAAAALKKIADKTADKLADEVAEDIARFYRLVRAAILKYAQYVRPRNRPVTYVFVAPGELSIEFVACSNNPDLVMSAVGLDKFQAALSRAREFVETLGAVRIQYLLGADGVWQFNYLLTSMGTIIGTEQAYSNRARKIQLMSAEVELARSVDRSELASCDDEEPRQHHGKRRSAQKS